MAGIVLQVRISPELMGRVRGRAKEVGQGMSEWVRGVLVNAVGLGGPVVVKESVGFKEVRRANEGGEKQVINELKVPLAPCDKHSWIMQAGGGYRCVKCGATP